MSEEKRLEDDIFECKMYITDLETNKDSKEINVSDLVFNDYIEFEFGNYEDEDYGTLPYKDFKFFINDYSVTFYSPQYKKIKEKLNKQKEILNKIKEILLYKYPVLNSDMDDLKQELLELLEEIE